MTDSVTTVACGCCERDRPVGGICPACDPTNYCGRCARCWRHCRCYAWLAVADAGIACQVCNTSVDVVTLTLADGDGVRLCVKCLEVACEFAQP